jgi:hypothetical protein
MQFTRIPWRPHSPACDSVNLITPAFEAAYGSIVLEPCTPEVDDRFMMQPPVFCAINWRAEALEQKKVPFKLIETTARHPLGDVEPAEVVDRLSNHRIAFCGVAHIDHEHLAGAAELADLVTHGLEMAGVAAGDQYRCPAYGKFARNGNADASATARYDGNLALNAEYVLQRRSLLHSC